MNNKIIPDLVYKELEFIKNSIKVPMNSDFRAQPLEYEKIFNKIPQYKLNEYTFTFFFKEENIRSFDFLANLYYLIDEYNLNSLIVCATPTIYPRSCHPLTALTLWSGSLPIRNTLSWHSPEEVELFDASIFKDNVYEYEKNVKGILSVRKNSIRRDYVFNNISNYNDIITRYASWPVGSDIETEYDLNRQTEFPTQHELIDEYKSSIFSFIIESESLDFSPTRNITEKTLIAFLTGTIPIVLGGKNYVKELKDMGFYVWNDEFGFDTSYDLLEEQSFEKADKFIECIERVNKLSMKESIEMWKLNQTHLQKNMDIVRELILINDNSISYAPGDIDAFNLNHLIEDKDII